jgi:hypothetical protein
MYVTAFASEASRAAPEHRIGTAFDICQRYPTKAHSIDLDQPRHPARSA